jgi:hypothetical protein
MRALNRSRRPLWAVALPFALLVLFAGSRDVYWHGDFYLEVYPAYLALQHGFVDRFFDLLPGYSGFAVVVGAPLALVAGGLDGMETMTYRFTAVPGLFALAALGVAIAGPVKARGNHYWPVFLLCGAGGALAYQTTLFGHPEDLLATGLAVGAVLVARQGRVNLATAMIMGAVVSKQWAVLAILPVAMAAPRAGIRIAVLASLGTALLILLQTQEGSAAHGTITSTGNLFHPHQVWWPFGIPATPEFIAAGHGERMGPEWLAPLVRPIIVATGGLVAIAWWLRSGPRRDKDDVLGVLALVFLLRCMLDPWNLVYYELPLVVSLAAWEARKGRDLPALSVVATAATWLTFVTYDSHVGNGPFFAYLAWSVPLALGLGWHLLVKPIRLGSKEAGLVPAPSTA